LDFPFLKRYSRRFLEKHPELRGTDMETTRRKCAKFRHTPVSVMNFLEGTRFTREKHRKQQSSYAHLLLPKAGGVAMVLSNMGDYLSHILDVTIVYPYNSRSVRFWDLLSGRISTVVVKVRQLAVPEGVAGRDYAQDDAYRKMIQQWVNRVWEDKDRQIDALLAAPRRAVCKHDRSIVSSIARPVRLATKSRSTRCPAPHQCVRQRPRGTCWA
jgi:1-acyl-sn-glycerol-3-phosphate acyltransferase